MNVVPIKSRSAGGAQARHGAASQRPRVFIIDRPGMCLLAAILGVFALIVVGALANGMLSAPRHLACDAPGLVQPSSTAVH